MHELHSRTLMYFPFTGTSASNIVPRYRGRGFHPCDGEGDVFEPIPFLARHSSRCSKGYITNLQKPAALSLLPAPSPNLAREHRRVHLCALWLSALFVGMSRSLGQEDGD